MSLQSIVDAIVEDVTNQVCERMSARLTALEARVNTLSTPIPSEPVSEPYFVPNDYIYNVVSSTVFENEVRQVISDYLEENHYVHLAV